MRARYFFINLRSSPYFVSRGMVNLARRFYVNDIEHRPFSQPVEESADHDSFVTADQVQFWKTIERLIEFAISEHFFDSHRSN